MDGFDPRYIDEAAREKRRAETLDDHGREMAGVNGSRQARFSIGEGMGVKAHQDKRRKDEERLTMQHIRELQAEEQERLTRQLTVTLTRFDDAATRALDDLGRRLINERAEFEARLSGANRLADGRYVFKTDSGQFVDESGAAITADERASLVEKDGAVTFAEFNQRRDNITALEQGIEDVRRYQVEVIGAAREEMSDPKTRLTQERVDEITRELESKAPPILRERMTLEFVEPTETRVPTRDVTVPTLPMG